MFFLIAVPDIDPVAIYFGPIKIYWYGFTALYWVILLAIHKVN